MTTDSFNSIASRLLEPIGQCITPETARKLLELRADPALQAEVDALADKSTAGTLTAEEREKYESYIAAASIIAILQSKARALLKPTAA
jgi:hypothetical protein